MRRPVRTAVIPAGGLGTRFLPATKAVPKEMLPVVDKPLIQYAVEEARAAGIDSFVFVTARGKAVLEDHFDHATALDELLAADGKEDLRRAAAATALSAGMVAHVRQPAPLGLGHAVWCARHVVGATPFAVLLPDDLVLSEQPCIGQLLDAHREHGGNVVAVMDVPRADTGRYGVLDVAADDGRLASVQGLVEKPAPADAPSTLAIVGRYVLDPSVMAALDAQEPGAGGEIQLTDAMARTVGDVPFHGLRFEGRRFDCGDKLGFLEANIACALARPEMAAAARDILARFA
ncbi:MAG: UTP--glucose-1-phosphate uridylyltransferase [Alphaproteobacteria bacterium]|nr:UTP--glucose-1-phosphate uridylyltransferase [Alphaproteobacteria bacterium]MCY4231529.1 UTP--glucose-1-phosphate uridylyltransferase [Alphaproteobacteria bacterium]MCY4317918.1 UTP--glucose-1-phosphate uridylyltransferase [Alphaproteobacteria bacterium]